MTILYTVISLINLNNFVVNKNSLKAKKKQIEKYGKRIVEYEYLFKFFSLDIFFALVSIYKHWPSKSKNQIVWKIKIEKTVLDFLT